MIVVYRRVDPRSPMISLAMRLALPITMIGTVLSAGPTLPREHWFDPTSVYRRESIHGFTVLVNPEVSIHKREAAEMREELDSQLAAIVREMPADHLPALRKVWIWVEWQKQKDGAASFILRPSG